MGDARELADIDEQMPVPPDIGVDDVDPGPAVQLGILQTFGGVELSMGSARLVEDLGQDPPDVIVVVEHLAVVAACTVVAFGEDGTGPVDHYLPHVGIGEEGFERSVTSQIPERPLDGAVRIGDVNRSVTLPELVAPGSYFL